MTSIIMISDLKVLSMTEIKLSLSMSISATLTHSNCNT